jgi:hypothetical protein
MPFVFVQLIQTAFLFLSKKKPFPQQGTAIKTKFYGSFL